MKIYISKLISTDIRSRSNINRIEEEIRRIDSKVELDFSEVDFMSRSFADELYNFVESHKNVSICNINGIARSMIEAVRESRNSKRVYNTDDSEIKEFEDIKSLSSFLATI